MPAGPGGLLGGVAVLDLALVGPGARCTRALADYGATVVKVGPPDGVGRRAPLPPSWAYAAGRGTAQARIDLRADDGRRAFLALAAAADVVVESFRPGVVDRLGIGYAQVAGVNERIVYCSTSGYGQRSTRAGWAGHDLDYLAVGGFLAGQGRGRDGRPALPGTTVADAAAGGLQAAVAVMAALFERERSGRGCHLDVAVADGVLWLMALQADEHLATGVVPGPGHDVVSGRYACYDCYQTADGRWLAVGAIEPAFFANLCRALGLAEWADRQYDDEAQPALRGLLAAAFAQRSRDEWTALLADADTCVAPVLDVAEAVAQAAASAGPGVVVDAVGPDGPRRQLGPLLAGTVAPAEPVVLPDPTVTATGALLGAAGLGDDQVADLLDRGIIA